MLVQDLLVIGKMWDINEFALDLLVVDEDKDIGGENDLAILEEDALDSGEAQCLATSISLSIALDTLCYSGLIIKLK